MAERRARRPETEAGDRAEATAGAEMSSTEGSGAEVPTAEAAGAEGDTAATVADLKERVTSLEDQWRRSLADLDNLRKRLARDIGLARAEERREVVSQWVPILDNLDRALDHAGADPDAIAQGVRAIRDQAIALLAKLGFPRQRAEPGDTFDPSRHDAVATLPRADVPEGTVVGVVQPGYGAGERQLRPSSVVVATRPETTQDVPTNEPADERPNERAGASPNEEPR
jgi:molecular chaperone GrpE